MEGKMQQQQQNQPSQWSSSTGSLTRKLKGGNWFWKQKLCTSCVKPLSFLSSGSNCGSCGLRVCKNCRHYFDVSQSVTLGGSEHYQLNWVCILCSSSPNYLGPKLGVGKGSTKSIRRSWTISNPQRGNNQQNSPILKSYTIYNEDNTTKISRQFNSLPRLSYGHLVHDENQSVNGKSSEDYSTLYPFKNHKSNSNSSVNFIDGSFIEDIYWDYFGTPAHTPAEYRQSNSNRSSCERSLGEEFISFINPEDPHYQHQNPSQNQNPNNSNNSSTTIINNAAGFSGSSNNINNNPNNNQKGKSTTIPIKPERANKRSNSLNSYDGKKLSFSPLKTYVILRQSTPCNNNNSSNSTTIPTPSNLSASTKKRSSSFNLDYCGPKRNRAELNSANNNNADFRERLDEIKSSLYSNSHVDFKRPFGEHQSNCQTLNQSQGSKPTTTTSSSPNSRKTSLENEKQLIRDIREPLMKLKRSGSNSSTTTPNISNNNNKTYQSDEEYNNLKKFNASYQSGDRDSSQFLFGTLPKRKSKNSNNNNNNTSSSHPDYNNSYSSLERRIKIKFEQDQYQDQSNPIKKILSISKSADKIPISSSNPPSTSHDSLFSSLHSKQAKYFHRDEKLITNLHSSPSPSGINSQQPHHHHHVSTPIPVVKPPRKAINNNSKGRAISPHQMSTLPKSFSYTTRRDYNNTDYDPNLENLLKKSEKLLNPSGINSSTSTLKSNNNTSSNTGNVNIVQIINNQTFPRRKPLLLSSSSEANTTLHNSYSSLDRKYARNNNNNTLKVDADSSSSDSLCVEECFESAYDDENSDDSDNNNELKVGLNQGEDEENGLTRKQKEGVAAYNEEESTIAVGGWVYKQQVKNNNSSNSNSSSNQCKVEDGDYKHQKE